MTLPVKSVPETVKVRPAEAVPNLADSGNKVPPIAKEGGGTTLPETASERSVAPVEEILTVPEGDPTAAVAAMRMKSSEATAPFCGLIVWVEPKELLSSETSKPVGGITVTGALKFAPDTENDCEAEAEPWVALNVTKLAEPLTVGGGTTVPETATLIAEAPGVLKPKSPA